MNHGSLFSGEGGFDLAAEWMGWNNIFHVEKNPFCQTILKYYWPHAKSFTDIKDFNPEPFKGYIDVLSGGFPCQPFSIVGKRAGSTDDRFLWPEYLRCIRILRPKWVTGENVPGIITSEKGLVFKGIVADLENEGYKVWVFNIPALSVEAPHKRNRIWIVANYQGKRSAETREHFQRSTQRLTRSFEQPELFTNSLYAGLEGYAGDGNEPQRWERPFRYCSAGYWSENWFKAATRLCTLDDGVSGGLDLETISQSKWRVNSLQAAGNAIVPQVAYQIFDAIDTYNIIYG